MRSLVAEDWGYKFSGDRTINKFIRDIEGEAALAKYCDWECRERAELLMSEIAGTSHSLFYVRRQKVNERFSEEEIWELILATDGDNFELPELLQKADRTLRLLATVRTEDGIGGLKLLDAGLVALPRGRKDGYVLPVQLRLLPQTRSPIPAKSIARIQQIPFWDDRHIPTTEQLKVWHTFLNVEKRIAEARQFCVPFRAHNYGSGLKTVTFEIDRNSATLDGYDENPLQIGDFRDRLKQARNEDIILFDSPPGSRSSRDGETLGSIAEIEFERGKLRIKLDFDLGDRMAGGRYQLPKQGFLYFEAAGDISQIDRKKKALKMLTDGRAQNPYLSEFLFDSSQARIPDKLIKLDREDLLNRNANDDQLAAVEMVLSARDLILIQGPPGTGKTTVIAEICYQIARQGGKTLIASQANLAVDNALSRLVHNPAIRALRKGKAHKVQEEGQPFLEENAIGTWLQNTAIDCEQKLSQRQKNITFLRQLLADSDRFNAYFATEKDFFKQLKHLHDGKADIEEKLTAQTAACELSLTAKSKLEFLVDGLANLLSTPDINWESSEVAEFMPKLKPYSEGNVLVENFMANVRICVNHAIQIGLDRPMCGAFGIAVWLRETVAAQMSEFKAAGDRADEVCHAMSAVAESLRVSRQLSEAVNQLQLGDKQNQTHRHNLEQKIKNLELRKTEIAAVVVSVAEWIETADATLYTVVQSCCETGAMLTDEMVELPAGLLKIARSLKLPIVPPKSKVNLPDLERLQKAISHEASAGFKDIQGQQFRFSEFLHLNLNQTPLVLAAGDRAQWQQLAQDFASYNQLSPSQRKFIVEKANNLFSKIQQLYSESLQPNQIQTTCDRLVKELLHSILANARQCIIPLKTETEQQLIKQQQLLDKIGQTLNQQQISAAQNQVETAQQEANLKISEVTNLLQAIVALPNLPERLRSLAEQYLAQKSNIWEQPQHFVKQIDAWKLSAIQLEKSIADLDPFGVLENIKNRLDEQLLPLQTTSAGLQQQLAQLQAELNDITAKLQQQQPTAELIIERNWWESTWQSFPEKYKPEIPNVELFAVDFLRKIKRIFNNFQKELEREQTALNRSQTLVTDWIEKLRHPSEKDRNDLKQIYIDNANVIGITCVQAASFDFSKNFPSFDAVIVDEVSKCTPPELLIPALKGRKLVLVGDHRQLPPMFDRSTIDDIAEDIGCTGDELSFIKESLFKVLFENASDGIKKMLTTQYRMHPQIMGAINQFYQQKLNCGILEADTRRAHNLAGKIIQENHHLLWVKTPVGQGFEEEKQGTSRLNVKEIDAIELLCEQMENAWRPKILEGEPPKEIGIITFYGAQLNAIKDRIEAEKFPSLSIRTGTVDIFQGMERPVIIVSTVCNNVRGDIGFAKEPERVNVAFSRAQELLVVVGCHDLFTQQTGTVGKMYQEVSKTVRHWGGFVDVSSVLS
ncbi:AAA family ATPase [Tychonema sp. LEGE 07199]|uniref:AAA domain-containing protein n=1 Tax=unclassified Tychonema TaxID=2642144 RepID=UPI001882DA39|nr:MULTISPECIES: AAA domain-containing protein [unclassified Tychonema]MBE9122740.1 AAA family ATPase [Tychonema sp. LEGE 07199]MBE9134621.1 AAA family ATPase [Tychonema sp. LEGE 07196]